MAELKQLTSYVREFLMVQSSDHITGLTAASPKLNLSMAGAPFASTNAVIAEIGNGYYKASLTSTDTRTLGDLGLHFTAASADPTDFIDQVRANILGDTLPASIAGTVTAGTVLDKLGYGLAGTVTAGTVIDKTGYVLAQAFPANFAALGILAGGQVGIDWGNVANPTTVNALTRTTVNSSQSVVASAPVTVGTNNDKTGYGLSAAERASSWSTVQSESYAPLHAVPSPYQAVLLGLQMSMEKSVNGTSVTVLQSDGATLAASFTLDSTSPTKIPRAA